MPTIVPDLTAIINQKVLDVARQLGVDETITVIICNKVLTTIEDLASREVPSGLLGLSHLQLLCTREDATCIDVQIWAAGDWERDSTVSEITRKVAMDEQALLVTCDEIQH
ncbi:hypothetical protein GF325_10285, partial [Candidatus Bathyarchaeota archaeon]|nr:hypothetical protein [Candidatus Bathyarchaeota archaeon]